MISSVDLKSKAAQLGYLKCGVIPADISDEYNGQLDERAGKFPESKALYEPLHNKPPENAKSIIVCTLNYAKYIMPDILEGLVGKFYLFDSRMPYAYESRAKAEFETYMKTLGIGILQGNVPARLAAAKAGIGKFGRNNFIYDDEHGSYIWIDAWFVDTELDYDAAVYDYLLPECGGDKCLKCVKACPTGALSGGLAMDRGRCVTHLMSNAKGALDGALRERMGTWIYGCDACQDACPVNENKRKEAEDFPLLAEHARYLQPERIMEMDEQAYENVVNPRFWYLGKDSMWLWKCNALRSMINSGGAKYHETIKRYVEHDDERIREVAQWGCDKLGI